MDKLEEKLDMTIKDEIKLIKKDEELEEKILGMYEQFIENLERHEEELIQELTNLDQAISSDDVGSEKEKEIAVEALRHLNNFEDSLDKLGALGKPMAQFMDGEAFDEFMETRDKTESLREGLTKLTKVE